MLVFTEKVAGVAVTKGLYQVADLTGRTVPRPDGTQVSEEYINVGGVMLTGNTLIFLDAADGARLTTASLVAAVSNNALASFANTGSNVSCVLTSVGA